MDAHAAGALSEIRAEQYLAAQGMTILARNVRAPGSEAVTPAKQRRICRGALYYMMQNGLMNRQARFDVLEIQGERVTHIRDAFPYQE